MKSIDQRINDLKPSSDCKSVSELDKEAAKAYTILVELRSKYYILSDNDFSHLCKYSLDAAEDYLYRKSDDIKAERGSEALDNHCSLFDWYTKQHEAEAHEYQVEISFRERMDYK